LGIFDARLNGEETKSLVGRPELGSPSKFAVKHAVQQIRDAAFEFAHATGDLAFVRQFQKFWDAQAATVQKRQATARQRQVAAG